MDAREVFGLGRLVNIFRKRLPEVAQASSGVGQGEDPRSDSAATMPVGDESDLEGQDRLNCSTMNGPDSEIDARRAFARGRRRSD